MGRVDSMVRDRYYEGVRNECPAEGAGLQGMQPATANLLLASKSKVTMDVHYVRMRILTLANWAIA